VGVDFSLARRSQRGSNGKLSSQSLAMKTFRNPQVILSKWLVRLFVGLLLSSGLIANAEENSDKEKSEIALARKALDETVWAPIAEAVFHGDRIVDLWDKLREAENPLETLQTYPLGSVEAPQWKLSRRLPEKIFEFVHTPNDGGISYLKSYQLQTMINGFVQEGYQLDQIDLRQIDFDVEKGKAVSKIEFELNVSGPIHTLYRRAFRGVARVEWSGEMDDDGIPLPESLSFESLRQYRRTGKPAFETRDWLSGSNSRSPYLVILVEDFNDDGRPDILFPRENRLYRNVGDFKFDPRPMVKHFDPEPIDSALFVDIDLDGEREYVTATRGVGVQVFERSRKSGLFDQKPKLVWKPKALIAAQSISAGDVDGDGRPDLFVGQHMEPYVGGILPDPYYDANDGLPSFLLLNQGNLKFKESIARTGLAGKAKRRVSASSIVDIDRDGRFDLLLTNNFAGVDVFSSDDSNLLADRSEDWFEERAMLGSGHLINDFNRDGILDFFAFGRTSEHGRLLDASGISREGFELSEQARASMVQGNRLWLGSSDGFDRYEDSGAFLSGGWAHGATDIDFNNDGFEDVYLSNGYITKGTVKDYSDIFWRHDLYDRESDLGLELARFFLAEGPGSYLKDDLRSWAPLQKNKLWANFGDEGFVDIAYLMGASLEIDGRATLSEDLNLDGKPDLIAIEMNGPDEKVYVKFLENKLTRVGNWVGVQLKPAKKRSIAGAQVTVIGEGFRSTKAHVSGDRYYAQSSSLLRFGLGDAKSIEAIEIAWPDGEKSRIANPAVNRYHSISPEE